MNSRERILAALDRKPVDRVPWVPLCSQTFFFSLPEYQKRFAPDWRGSNWPAPSGSWEDELQFRVDFYRNIGAEFMSWGEFGGIYAQPVHAEIDGVKTTETRDGDLMITETHTPVGTLRRVSRWVADAFTGYTIEHPLKGPADWRVQEYLLDHTDASAENSQARRALEIIGRHGAIFVGTPGSPMMQWFMGEFSIDGVTYALADYPEELASLERKQHEHNLAIVRLLTQNPGRIFCSMAVLGTAMVSKAMVQRHYVPQMKEYADLFRDAGKHLLCHASGEPVGSIIPEVIEIGLSGLYGIRQWPLPGAPGVVELKDSLGQHIAIAGGLDGDFLYRSTPAQIKDAVSRLLDEMTDHPGFILATADDMPHGTPPSNLEAVSQAVQAFYG